MTTDPQPALTKPDPAAVFACATSLWRACHGYAAEVNDFNISDCFNGIDQLMREVMAIGTRFEEWACEHVKFDEVREVWPYMLEDKFGDACLTHLFPDALSQFDENDCLSVALRLRLPVILDDGLAIPIDLTASNPINRAGFQQFRIQTVRDSLDDGGVVPFVVDDDPNDEEFGERYFALYGIGDNETLEHIADRKTYGAIYDLAQKLAPGISFPIKPTFRMS